MTRDVLHLTRFRQSGVLARFQLLEAGISDNDVRRLVRRKELVRVHEGVYVNHTGLLTATQRHWAAVLAHWPAALTSFSALPGPPRTLSVHIAIPRARRAVAAPGVVIHRRQDLDPLVLWHESPPRVQCEEAALTAAGTLTRPDRVYELLADVVRRRGASPQSLLEALDKRARVSNRALFRGVLGDLGAGAESWLEKGWLEVERVHGLPRGERQVTARAAGRSIVRDVRYPAHRLVVELDGQTFHESARARDRDARRDLATLVDDGEDTVRVTYGMVFRTGCSTALQVGRLLTQRGWTGTFRPCPHC